MNVSSQLKSMLLHPFIQILLTLLKTSKETKIKKLLQYLFSCVQTNFQDWQTSLCK